MISPKQAVEFATKRFPRAPEELAAHLGISIRESSMDGCDGWCLTNGKQVIIRLNTSLSPTRKRFTLAHELGHLILGIPAIVGESYEDMLASDSDEERRVNELASALLIPKDVAKASLSELPVVAAALMKLAKKANVSQLMAAIRVCNLASEIGLQNASVVLFDGSQVRWQWSKTLTMPNETAADLLVESRKAVPQAFRRRRPQGDVIVASTIENPYFGSATLFVQLLPEEIGLNISHHEKRKQLELTLFSHDVKLQQRMSGYIGALKNRIEGKTQKQVEADFWTRYRETLKNTAMDSNTGQAYVRLRISEWF
jgi:Zn-dependent peptidase ImmA (M78 family)